MALLDDIIRDATTDEVPLTTVLRRTLILATELRNAALKEWVRRELNGYPNAEELPDYRVISTQARGMFSGLGYVMKNQIISSHVLEEAHQRWATRAYLAGAVSTYETMLAKDGGTNIFNMPWPAPLVAYYQDRIIENAALHDAWLVMPSGALSAMMDVIRTRILELALEIRQAAGGREDVAAAVPEATVERVVIQQIFNGDAVVAHSIAGGVRQGGKVVVKGDFNSLAAALRGAGVSDDDVAALKKAVEEDAKTGAKAGMGARVAAWLGERAQTLGDGVAGAAVGALVLKFFGLG